jgi:putative ABC transport system permease protein
MGILTRATRNITRRKTRALLVIVALSLALTMLISIPPSITANQEAAQKTIDSLTASAEYANSMVNRVATEIDCNLPLAFRTDAGPYHNESVLEQPLMNVTDYSNLTSIPDVASVIPILQQNQRDSEGKYLYDVIGIPLDASLLTNYPTILPANITAGRNLQAGDSGVVVLQERVANLFGVGVDGTVNILGQNFKVVGIQGQDAYNATAAYMSLDEAQIITNTTGQAMTFKVFATSIDNVGTIENDIKTAYPELSVITAKSLINQAHDMQQRSDEQIQRAQAGMNQIQSTATVEMGVVILADCVIVLFIMLYTVRERTKEIGTLKALGASNKTILGQFMLEGVLLSLIAGIVGLAIGTFAATTLANLLLPYPTDAGFGTVMSEGGILKASPIVVTITPQLILFGLGVAVLLGALGSLYPAWRAARIRPAEAMRYE